MIRDNLSIKQKIVNMVRPVLYTRPMIKAVMDMDKKNLVGVEIGVAEGYNAYNILRVLDMKKLYLVDSYEGDWNEIFGMSQRLLKPFRKKVVFVNLKSKDAVDMIPGDLDFVYIDGCHSLSSISDDYHMYKNKVKSGGVIGGHDFNIRTIGVVDFVLGLEHRYGRLVKTGGSDWWIIN